MTKTKYLKKNITFKNSEKVWPMIIFSIMKLDTVHDKFKVGALKVAYFEPTQLAQYDMSKTYIAC